MTGSVGPGLVEGKVALVTGGGSGIGRATALQLAAEGARLVVADLDPVAGLETVAAIEAQSGTAIFQATDVSREDEVEALVARAVDHFGSLDCALNNAGVSGVARAIQDTDSAEFQRVIGINLLGTFLCLKHELAIMVPRGSGSIVNMASGAGLVGTPTMCHYSASKHAVLGLTKTAALENARTGVRVNAVCPGSTDTPMLRKTMEQSPAMEKLILASTPSGRLGTPEQIAEAVVWLLCDRASFVHGESMLVDGGSVVR